MPEPFHLLNWQDVPPATWQRLLTRARKFAATGERSAVANGRSVGLLFFNPSLRTRTSMEVAAAHLGAHATAITPGSGVWSFDWSADGVMDGDEAEHIEEAIGVLSRYFDAIGVRLFSSLTDRTADREDVRMKALAAAATVPIINLESAFWHPCQELADAATIMDRFGGDVRRRRFVLAWAHHPKPLPMAVPNSALMMAARLGMDVTVARPDGFELDDRVMSDARALSAASGGSVSETADLHGATHGADVVYAKAWSSSLIYDDPDEEARMRQGLKQWRITMPLMQSTNAGAFMHCLPVRRNVVVDTEVLKSPHAIHLTQAAYRLHAQKAILMDVLNLT